MPRIIGLLVLLWIFLFVSSCRKKEVPAQKNEPAISAPKGVRKVLLEDYTGHQCGYCPPAAARAEALYRQYNGNLVVMVVHAGYFTATHPQLYPTSYTTTAGEDWNNPSGFDLGKFGNPIGMINRKNYYGNSMVYAHANWNNTIAQAFEKDPYILGLEIIPSYNASSRTLNTVVKTKFGSAYANTLKLSLVLLEDSIIGPQADYSLEPDKRIPDFVFMHMMRGAINGSWGDTLEKSTSDRSFAAGDSLIMSYPNFVIDRKFNDKHLSVVAFVYDALSREVLQVEEVKIK